MLLLVLHGSQDARIARVCARERARPPRAGRHLGSVAVVAQRRAGLEVKSDSMPRRYVCYGVGGVGGVICAKLAQSGLDVVAIARGEHLSVIQKRGLRLRTPAEDITLPIRAVRHPSELEVPLGSEDAVIISTKANQALDVLATIAELTAGDEPAVICCTNGINTELASLRCK